MMTYYEDIDTDIKEENDILPLFTDEIPSQPTSSRDRTTGIPTETGLVSQNILKSDYGLCSNVDLKCFEEEYFKYVQCASEVDDSYSDNNSDSDESPRDIFSTDENVQYLLEDVEEDMVINGCGCEKSCHEQFVREDVLRSRLETKSMNSRCNLGQNHLNLYVLGAINALTRRGPFTNAIHRKPKKRARFSTKFHFQGVPVCKNFFRFVNALGTKKFKNLLKKFGAGNLNLQSLKGTSTTFQNQEKAMATQQNIDAVLFLKSFAEQNALILPGRVPYHRNTDLMILPSSMNKRYVFEKYQDAAKLSDKDAVSFRTWYDLWTEFVPNIVAQKPRTDLCNKCQQNITSLGKMQCLSEQVKQSLIEKSALHINIVQAERAYYKQSIENSAETFRNHKLGQNEPCSRPGTMHYSFDFAQQVHLPHSSQVGPLYFLNGYKVGLFGIAAEPLKQFVLYIIPEACNTGKGSNTVISLVDHFFNNFALGETDVICHADNCCEQNKNDFLMQYALWRTMTGKHHSFQLSFLPVGHAKFAPDLYFGLFKKKFRDSNSNSIKDLFECAVTACHNSDTITAVMVGNETGDEIHVQSYNWADYFEGQYPQTVPNLLSYNHFKTSNNYPGLLQCTKSFDDDYKLNIKVFDDTMNTFREITSPTVIPPTRLTFERQEYLFQKIRPYVALEAQNVLCPKPVKRETTWDIPLVGDPLQIVDSKTNPPMLETAPVRCIEDYDNDLPTSSNMPSLEETDPTSTKRKTPKCSYCGELGHRNQKRNNTYFCKKRAEDEDRGAE